MYFFNEKKNGFFFFPFRKQMLIMCGYHCVCPVTEMKNFNNYVYLKLRFFKKKITIINFFLVFTQSWKIITNICILCSQETFPFKTSIHNAGENLFMWKSQKKRRKPLHWIAKVKNLYFTLMRIWLSSMSFARSNLKKVFLWQQNVWTC